MGKGNAYIVMDKVDNSYRSGTILLKNRTKTQITLRFCNVVFSWDEDEYVANGDLTFNVWENKDNSFGEIDLE